MKKSLFAILAIAACFASCSKVVESPVLDNEIAFDNYVGKDAMTKASIITGDGITNVKVNAYLHPKTSTGGTNFTANFMNGQDVAKNGTYSPAKYWPAVDQAVDFVAWVPVPDYTVTGEGTTATTKNNIKIEDATLTFTVPTDVKNQSDLLVAEPVLDQNRAADNSAVNLNFKHLLSRIGFTINATGLPGVEDATTKVELVHIKLIGNFPSTGEVDMTKTPLVKGEPSEVSYMLAGSNFVNKSGETSTPWTSNMIVGGENPNADDSYIMLIPTSNGETNTAKPTKIEVFYTVKTYDGDNCVGTIENKSEFDLTGTTYEPGKAYRYTFTIKMEAISFEVTEEAWKPESSTNITPYSTVKAKNGENSVVLYYQVSIAVGTVVYIDNGTTKASAGTYVLEDGRTITVDANGSVTAITPASTGE